MEYNQEYEQHAKEILRNEKSYIYSYENNFLEHIENNINEMPNYLFPELEGEELEEKNQDFLNYLCEIESKVIENEIGSEQIKAVISSYKSSYNPEKTNEKLKIYIGGEYNEPMVLCHNGIELNINDTDTILFIIWARAQENIIIEKNARW